MRYQVLRCRGAIKNTWSVEEIDFQIDLSHLQRRMSGADRHLIERLVAFFATGDSIVANNLVLSLYKHINAPEARMYLSRQLFEEALHVQFYLTLLDNYVPDQDQRARLRRHRQHSFDPPQGGSASAGRTLSSASSHRVHEDKRRFLLNLTRFASCIEGCSSSGVRLSTSLARTVARIGARHQLGLARGAQPWHSPIRCRHGAPEEPGCSTRTAQVKTMIEEAVVRGGARR
jgi:hypothetical protein